MDAAPPLVVSRWSTDGASPPLPAELVTLPSVTAMAGSQREALAAALAAFPGCDVLLLRADAVWPVAALARLQAGWSEPWDVLSPEDRQTLAWAGDTSAVDSRAWGHRDHAVWASAHVSDVCSLWRGAAAAAWLDNPSAAVAERQLGRLPCVFVGPAATSQAIDEAVGADPDISKPAVLHVLHCWGGGIERFARDLAKADDQRRHLFLIAHNDSDRPPFGRRLALYSDLDAAPLRAWPLAAPISATAIRSQEVAALLSAVIPEWGIGAVLVSSLIGHSLDVLRTGLPTAWCTHDAYPVWPMLHERRDANVTALDRECLRQSLAETGDGFLFAERDSGLWWALRTAFIDTLQTHDVTVVAPSDFARDRLLAMAPELGPVRWQRIDHGIAPFEGSSIVSRFRAADAPLRVLVAGRISGDKGERLLAELLPRLPAGVEMILLGCGHAGERFLGMRDTHLLKDYRRDELPDWIARLKPDLALLPSTVPETFSYTLSEMRALGLPVLCANFGAYPERLHEGGWCVETNATAFANTLQQLRDDRTLLAKAAMAVHKTSTCQQMASQWHDALPSGDCLVTIAPATAERVAWATAETQLREQERTLSEKDRLLRHQQRELDQRAEWASQLEQELRSSRQAKKLADCSLADTMLLLDTSVNEHMRLNEAHRALINEFELERSDLSKKLADSTLLLETSVNEHMRLREAHQALINEFELERSDLRKKLDDAHRYYQQDTADLIHQRDVALMQRDEFDRRYARLLRNSWWRLGAPLRWLVHRARAIASTSAYRIRYWRQLQTRLRNSLRIRGWRGTWQRLQQVRQSREPAVDTRHRAPEHQLAVDDLQLCCPDTPLASIIIPVYGQLEFTVTCLHSLVKCGDSTLFEVIVVDDASPDHSVDTLAKIPGLRLHRNSTNLGFIGACNAGATLARGDFVVFLNNDTAVQPGWLDALIATFNSHPDSGLVGSKLVYPDGRLQEAGGIVFSDASGWNYGRFDDPAHPAYNYVREVDYCSGAAIALPRKLFESLGGFDSHYAPAYYEDTDLAMRVRVAGFKVRYQPRSVVVHYEGITSGTDLSQGVKRHQVANQKKFLARWREVLRTRHPAPGGDISFATEHGVRARVLVMDACTPTPDRDSGSLRMQSLLSLLREEGFAVSFFPENLSHDGTYTEELQQLGIAAYWQPWMTSVPRWLEDHGPRFDLVIASRHYVLSPVLPLLRQFAPQARLVFDTVDLHHLREQREAELSGDEALVRASLRTRERELALIRNVDCTWVVSEAERTLLAEEVPEARVEVVSNIHQVRGPGPHFDEREGLLFVGGFRHPPNVDAALWLADEILPRIHAELPDVELHLVGGDAPDRVANLANRPGIRFHGYVHDLVSLLDRTRIGVAPLRYGAGVKGKVNHALAHGQPMVATRCAVEGMHLVDGEDVLVADDAEAFAEAVVRLYRDRELWQQLVEGGLINTRRYFSADAARPVIQRLLASLSRR